jgi:arginine:pyruvate transaminase
MAQASQRIRSITGGGSDGWDLYRRAKDLARRGIAVIDLTVGEHDVKTDPAILDAMHAAARGGHTGYATIPGIIELREAVAERAQRMTGVPTRAENVIVTPGGQAALFAAHQLVGDPGDRALFVEPHYATYPGTIRGTGLVPVPVTARAEAGFEPREEELMAAAPGARSLLVNSPNNPTGVDLFGGHAARDRAGGGGGGPLGDLDEVYDSQVWEGRHLSPRALPGLAERCLVVGSLSKSHAMTGSRLGWIIGPEAAIAMLGDLATVTNYGIPGFVQDAGVFALALGRSTRRGSRRPSRGGGRSRSGSGGAAGGGRGAAEGGDVRDARPAGDGASRRGLRGAAPRRGADRGHAGREFRAGRGRACAGGDDGGGPRLRGCAAAAPGFGRAAGGRVGGAGGLLTEGAGALEDAGPDESLLAEIRSGWSRAA